MHADCVTLVKLLNLSKPQFPYLQNRSDDTLVHNICKVLCKASECSQCLLMILFLLLLLLVESEQL